ncbi:MAG: hypothetical protein JNM21_11040 [Taibaiella sp.]|nr:hypothetical protein [Taibaiella sp.]
MSGIITKNTHLAKEKGAKNEKSIEASGSINKKTIITALLYLLLEIIFALIAGEITSLGIFAGLALSLGGSIVTFTHSYASAVFGGLPLMLLGIIVLWVNIKDISQSIKNKNQ